MINFNLFPEQCQINVSEPWCILTDMKFWGIFILIALISFFIRKKIMVKNTKEVLK